MLAEYRHKSKHKKVGVLPIRIVKSNVSSVGPSSGFLFLSDEGSMLKTLDFTIRIGSTPVRIIRLLVYIGAIALF